MIFLRSLFSSLGKRKGISLLTVISLIILLSSTLHAITLNERNAHFSDSQKPFIGFLQTLVSASVDDLGSEIRGFRDERLFSEYDQLRKSSENLKSSIGIWVSDGKEPSLSEIEADLNAILDHKNNIFSISGLKSDNSLVASATLDLASNSTVSILETPIITVSDKKTDEIFKVILSGYDQVDSLFAEGDCWSDKTPSLATFIGKLIVTDLTPAVKAIAEEKDPISALNQAVLVNHTLSVLSGENSPMGWMNEKGSDTLKDLLSKLDLVAHEIIVINPPPKEETAMEPVKPTETESTMTPTNNAVVSTSMTPTNNTLTSSTMTPTNATSVQSTMTTSASLSVKSSMKSTAISTSVQMIQTP